MKVGILSESEADEEILRSLLAPLAPESLDVIPRRVVSRGLPSVRKILKTVILDLYYQHDARFLVVVVDADESVLHEPAHEKSRGGFAGCRLCELRRVVRETTLNPRPERPPFDVAIGVAAPSLEAWLLHGRMPEASEEHWKRRATRSGSRVYIQDLKRKKYGTTTPSVPAQIERGVPNATSVARDLDGLAEAFPAGFRPLLATIREACGT